MKDLRDLELTLRIMHRDITKIDPVEYTGNDLLQAEMNGKLSGLEDQLRALFTLIERKNKHE